MNKLLLANITGLEKAAFDSRDIKFSLQYGLTKLALKPETLTAAAKKVAQLVAENTLFSKRYPKLFSLFCGRATAAEEINAAKRFAHDGYISNRLLGEGSVGMDPTVLESASGMRYAQWLRDRMNNAVMKQHNKYLHKNINNFDDFANRVNIHNLYKENASHYFSPFITPLKKDTYNLIDKYKLGKGGDF